VTQVFHRFKEMPLDRYGTVGTGIRIVVLSKNIVCFFELFSSTFSYLNLFKKYVQFQDLSKAITLKPL